MSSAEKILDLLRKIRFPGLDRDIVDLGYVKDVRREGDRWQIRLEISTSHPEAPETIERQVRQILTEADIPFALELPTPASSDASDAHQSAQNRTVEDLAPSIRHKLVVASGKGGVGKSTVAVNLALALAGRGSRVGLLDADIHGPSVPTMLGIEDQRVRSDEGKMIPIAAHGVRAISLGLFTDGLDPIIWRGPLASRAIEQLLSDVDWSDIEQLVLDLPPGTGDIQISIAQKANPTGAVIVTTPQDVALIDAIRGVRMFRKVEIPVLGLVENMSHFECPHCHQQSAIFPEGNLKQELDRLQVPVLGRIPIDPAIACASDAGSPIVTAAPESPSAQAYRRLAQAVMEP